MAKGLHVTADKQAWTKEYRCLDDYQDDVGCDGAKCLIEPVDVADGCTMYVDEEGSFHGAPFNSVATDVAGLSGRGDLLLVGLRGDVVIVGPLDDEGNDTDITDQARAMVDRVLREAR